MSTYREVACEPRTPFVLTITIIHPAFFLAPLVVFGLRRAGERFEGGLLALLLLATAALVVVCVRRRRVVVDYESGTLTLHVHRAPLDRVVRVHHTANLQIVVTLDDGEQLTLFPGGRSEHDAARNANAIHAAIHRHDQDDDYSKNF